MIEEESIQKLRDVTDIVDIISHYVDVKKAGSSYKCVCPFHDDKNPSMSISPSKQFYHCFACKAGGDAIKFVMDFEKLSYPEAVEKVAQLSNFTLTYTQDAPQKKENKHILENANALYRANLFRQKDAINYLYSRGINDAMIEKFELGWADDSNQTIRLLENDAIEPNEALQVGIVKQNEKGFYASFTYRITFPIYTHTARLVGFGGRTISNHPAKYINSPQSNIFDKSRLLYGYHLARKSISKTRQIIITEGYLDVIMLHFAGFDNAVAVLGTALTQKHIPLLKRDDINVVLCFDGDTAGINAAVRSSLLLTQNDIDGSVVIIEDGKDPADMVFGGKISYLKELFNSGTELGEFYIRQIAKGYDLSRPMQKQRCLDEILAYTKTLKAIVANSYIPLVSHLLGVDENSLNLSSASPKDTEFRTKIYKENKNVSKKNDLLELAILKSIFENKDMMDFFKSQRINRNFFNYHVELFDAIVSPASEQNAALLRELELNNKAFAITQNDKFLEALNKLRLRFYMQKQKQLRQSNDENKLEQLEKIKKIIAFLKQKR
ncbi:MAG: DNA primase [Campylobacter sp.]|nr:DNA primase [Campylobacter sp.]